MYCELQKAESHSFEVGLLPASPQQAASPQLKSQQSASPQLVSATIPEGTSERSRRRVAYDLGGESPRMLTERGPPEPRRAAPTACATASAFAFAFAADSAARRASPRVRVGRARRGPISAQLRWST